MHSAHPSVRHSQEQSSVPDIVTIAQHMVIAVNRVSVNFHIQDRSAVQFLADAARRRGKGSPDTVPVKAVGPEASPDHERRQKIGGSSEQLEKVGVHIDQMSAANPCDPPEHVLRLLCNGSSFRSGEGIHQIGDSRRSAVPSVGTVQPRKLSSCKAVFISLPARAPAAFIQ